jgi:hypothetical protein
MAATATFQDTTNNSILNTIQGVPVSGSGMDTTFVGPLSTLQQNPYAQQNLSYPRDLGSSQKAHSVVFRAYQITPTDFSKLSGYISKGISTGIDKLVEAKNALTNPDTYTNIPAQLDKQIEELKPYANDPKGSLDAFGNKIVNVFQNLTSDAKDASGAVSDTISSINSARATDYTKAPTGDVKDTITLYMPDNAESNYSASYGKIGLLAAAASVPVLGAIPNAIQGILGNEAVKVAMQTMGYVFNPQEQVMFEGIDFRTFNMSFTLTPFSREEATQIKNIIQTFRKNAAPRIASGGVGFFFVPPSIFEVTFKYGESENPNINKLKRCVLTDVNVNYAPNGTWSTHDDGSPVQTSLTLSFKEIELVDRTAVEAGY